MTEITNHEKYGRIVYTESFWLGKKTISVNGKLGQKIAKNAYLIDGKAATIKGSYLYGSDLFIEGEKVEIVKRPKWYELLLALIPFIFIVIWGSVPSLVEIFPVVGGALGGLIGALGGIYSVMLTKKMNTLFTKVLIGIGFAIATIATAFIVGILIIVALA